MRHAKRRRTVDISLPVGFSKEILGALEKALPTAEEGFRAAYLREKYLSKYCEPDPHSASQRRQAAIEKWLSWERRNGTTNARLYHAACCDKDFGWITWFAFCDQVRDQISRILGPCVPEAIFTSLEFTTGASTRVKRSPTGAIDKLNGVMHMTTRAEPWWRLAVDNTMLDHHQTTVHDASVLFTVPKKADIDRVACKEPEINVALQRCVGRFLARRLRRVGIDLTDQTVNQGLARGAVEAGLATIDLSSASDSICSQLVLQLLPVDWWSLLYDLRAPSILVDGVAHTPEMFSSMGNGFTFELESLLFYAILRVIQNNSTAQGRISVFGDDLIVASALTPRIIRFFTFIGFEVNKEKTFFKGPFRESCGKHYHGVFDVSPFFVRRPVSTLPDLIHLLNQVLEWDARGSECFTTPEIAAFHRKYSTYVPRKLWGGVCPSDPSALVTGGVPHSRLVPLMRENRRDELAAAKLWFVSRENTEEAISVEPSTHVAYTYQRMSRGWLTTYRPYIVTDGMGVTA